MNKFVLVLFCCFKLSKSGDSTRRVGSNHGSTRWNRSESSDSGDSEHFHDFSNSTEHNENFSQYFHPTNITDSTESIFPVNSTQLNLVINSSLVNWRCPNISIPIIFNQLSSSSPSSYSYSSSPSLSTPPLSCQCEVSRTLRCDGVVSGNKKQTKHILSTIINSIRNKEENESITLLDLSIQGVQFIPVNIFQDLDIRGLVLSTGNLVNISSKSFQGLEDFLVALGLPGNKLESIPLQAISILRGLTRLDLSGNSLGGVYSLPDLPDLEYLDISRNRIEVLAAGVFQTLPNLKHLILSENRLDLNSIREYNLNHLSYLTTLDLSSNLLTGHLRSPVFDLLPSNLKILDISFNNLTGLELNTFNILGSLNQLFLQGNLLDEIEDDSFSGLSRLHNLDLSHNNILTLSDKSFSGLTELVFLSLSHNHLQELSGVWLSGLYSLEDLMLMDNEITRVQEEIFITNKNITRLNLAGNPLNCDCEMSYLVSWLQDHDELKGDVESIKCATPSHLANAPLVLITERLECSNSTETEYYEYYSEPGSLPAISSSLVHLVHTQYNPDTDELDLSWDIKEVSRPFSCGQIHIFQDIESGVDLVSESSLLCEHQEILNTETLNTSINIQDLELDTDTPYIICISVLHQETVVPGCSGSLTISHHVEDKKTTSNLDSDLVFHPLVTPTSSLRMNANLSEENSIIVYLDTKLQEHTSTACSILTTVSTPGEQEIDHHVVDCSAQQDIFKNVPVRSVYRVCSVLKVGEETETEIKEGINSRECVLISPTRILYRDKSILPLLLTLVFLALGIACLTVLYLILKRAREDRRSEGFRSSPHPPLKLIFCCRKIADKLSRRDYSQHTFLQQADQWT